MAFRWPLSVRSDSINAMRDRWSDDDARAYREQFAAYGDDVALRVYTSRLIGSDPDLVLHGGGNTSVKTTMCDVFGAELQVLCVKGSGADLKDVEPPGLPAVELAPLLKLRRLQELGDEAMVRELRRRLLDPAAPNPSVEALLHAFVPHKFVDHTHADAILAVTNQPDGEARCRDVFGDDVVTLPWIMPGFPLAKAVADAVEAAPHCQGVVLLHHGIFSFGESARESYERMISLVDRAERYLTKKVSAVPAMLKGKPKPLHAAARQTLMRRLLPTLRGVLTRTGSDRLVANLRCDDAVASFAAHPDARALCETGPITPDHVIRTKGRYLFLSQEESAHKGTVEQAVHDYVTSYQSYFDRSVRPLGVEQMLPARPVVVVVEGAGLVAMQPDTKAARIAADIAEHTLRVWAQGQALGRYRALSPGELAEMEYWSLELAKLGHKKAPLLAGQVAILTGAAGAIGSGIAEVLLENGAAVLLTDMDEERLAVVARRLQRHAGSMALHTGDLTDSRVVEQLFAECVLAFGGVDLVVPSAGIAHVSSLEDMDEARFERVLSVNTTSTMHVLKRAAAVFRAQGTGGNIVLQVSKNAFAPGKAFGAYSASKAATLQLGRIAALEMAELDVRVNMINADAVFGDDQVPSQLWAEVGPERMRSRGLDAAGLREYYRDRNLLRSEVTARHVGEAVLFFASSRTPTTGAVLAVDGGLPEAFPR